MKNLNVIRLFVVLGLVIALSVSGLSGIAFAMENKGYETGTYKVTVSEGADRGYIVLTDDKGEDVDFIVITDKDYGYIYLDSSAKGLTYDIRNMDLELVSSEDLGVSGYHIYGLVEGARDFDPIIDTENVVISACSPDEFT